jgi:hypothetical protein
LRALQNSNLADEIRAKRVFYSWGVAEVVYDQPEKILHDTDQTEYHLAPQLTHLCGYEIESFILSNS